MVRFRQIWSHWFQIKKKVRLALSNFHSKLFVDFDVVAQDKCDQIGRFLKFLVTNFPSKVAQLYGKTWATSDNITL